jgi:hypothetical protein
MLVARRDALQCRDHELKTARGIEVVGAPVQPVDEVVTKGFEATRVAGQISYAPDGAVAIVVTRELDGSVGQIVDRRHVTSALVRLHGEAARIHLRGKRTRPGSYFLEAGWRSGISGGAGRPRITRTRDVSRRPSSHAEADEEAWP